MGKQVRENNLFYSFASFCRKPLSFFSLSFNSENNLKFFHKDQSFNSLSKPEHSFSLARTLSGECCINTLPEPERANGAQPLARSIHSVKKQNSRKEETVVKKRFFAALAGALMICTAVSAQDIPAEKPKGMGLSVMPGEMVIQNVMPGKEFDVLEKAGITLTISNNSDKARTYLIAPASPESLSLRNITGYSPLPDPRWLRLEKEEVEISPFSQKQIKMFIAIPQGDKYFNQKWCTALSVSSKPGEKEKLALQVTPIYYIETTRKEDLVEAPAGKTGVVPGVIKLNRLPLGLNKKAAKFRIYNNDQKIHRYKVYVYMPAFDPYTRKVISSPNYFWIRDGKWIRPLKKRVRIKPGESKDIEFDINIPQERRNAKKLYEALVFVESDLGEISFVRVKMSTGRVQKK